MKVLRKTQVPIQSLRNTDTLNVMFPKGAYIFHARDRGGNLEILAIIDTEHKEVEVRYFKFLGVNDPFMGTPVNYLGAIDENRYHVFEVKQ